MACLVYWMWINTSTANQPYVLKRNSTSPRDWELGSINTRRAWKLLLVSWERWQSQTLSAPTHPPLLPSCAQSRAKGCGKKWFSVQLGSGLVPGLAVHGGYAQGFRLSQDRTLKFVSARGPVSSPFRFLFLLLTFLWNLLPVQQWRAERQSQFKLFLLLCPSL